MAVSSNKQCNYRQEIRGVMQDPTTSSNSTTTNISSGQLPALHCQSYHPLPKPPTTSTPETDRQLIQNRLSRVHPQLQQYHFKNLWKHYRKYI